MLLNSPASLPISERREEIIAAITAHQCLILIGDTGSGKTTQLPKMCLAAGRGTRGMIACTQPRRIAALSVADRVAEETEAPDKIGCKIRFHDRTGEDTVIKFMTDGVLLAETRKDRLLLAYDTIIIDEAHERSLNIDFLLGYLKEILPKRPNLKLIISSATIDAEHFSKHFNQAPVISVSGRTFPITTRYWLDTDTEDEDTSYVDRAVAAVEELLARPLDGDILVFMPTERDINDTLDSLKQYRHNHLLLPLFGRLPAAAQRAVFAPSPKRKIIVATNVAETSITVPGIRFVVDTGLARLSRYNSRSGTTSLKITRISQASCEQRRGRCGRVGPGTCIRLYSEEDFARREAFTPPEIQRSSLAEVILQMIDLNLGNPATFPFIDPPPANYVRDGYRQLEELGAFQGQHRLSERGRFMGQLPIEPRISRIILEGMQRQALRETLILAAALSIQDPRVRPLELEAKADEAHRFFLNKQSDFLTLLNIWHELYKEEKTISHSKLSRFCASHYLSWQRMREWIDVHDQLHRLVRIQKRARFNTEDAPYTAIHMALTSGFLRNICTKKEKNTYLASSGREVTLFPGSGLYNKGPQWAVAAEFVETSRLYARGLAAIEPDWLEELAGPLCKRSWSEPHWEKKTGTVVAFERVTLFGLTIVAGRRVNYGRLNERTRKEAQEIFIRSALIAGQLGGHFSFLEHNLALRESLENLEDRLRRRGIVSGEETIFDFYAQRLRTVCDRSSLKKLLRDKKTDTFLRMSEEDISQAPPDADELYRFPPSLESGGIDIALQYHFAPGEDDDGVSALLSPQQLSQIQPQPFEWLVPGLLPEKILFLCKRLPKRLRRLLVPLPEAVDRLLDGLTQYKGSLYEELERVIFRQYQVRVERQDWQVATLPAYLRMRYVVQDQEGKMLAQSRTLSDLHLAQQNMPSQSSTPAQGLPKPRQIEVQNLDGIEVVIATSQATMKNRDLLYFATLQLDESGSAVFLHYLADQEKSREFNRSGLHFLYGKQFGKELSALKKECNTAISSHFASWLALGCKKKSTELKEDLFAFVLDQIFATADGTIPSCAFFAERVKQVQEKGFLRMSGTILSQVNQLLRQRREVSTTIRQWAERALQTHSYNKKRHEEFEQALERLLPADFLTLGKQGLAECPRYLQALIMRIKRAEHDPQKDEIKAKRLQTPEKRLEETRHFHLHAQKCQICLQEYMSMLEEFRVSVFAPELGTKEPVSEQRLQKKWQEVVTACRQVE